VYAASFTSSSSFSARYPHSLARERQEYRQLKETAAFLGASVVTKYFEGLTHYVTIGVASDREFRAARANNCAIVSPLWLVKVRAIE